MISSAFHSATLLHNEAHSESFILRMTIRRSAKGSNDPTEISSRPKNQDIVPLYLSKPEDFCFGICIEKGKGPFIDYRKSLIDGSGISFILCFDKHVLREPFILRQAQDERQTEGRVIFKTSLCVLQLLYLHQCLPKNLGSFFYL
jgi:hypothetical protein